MPEPYVTIEELGRLPEALQLALLGLAGLGLPLILLAAMGPRPTLPAGLETVAILTKPLKPRMLLSTLQKLEIKPLPAAPEVGKPAAPVAEAPGGGTRLLLAEDNLVNQKVAMSMLKRMGWQTHLARNGLEAVEAMEKEDFRVILMDMQMPSMDGLEATRLIRTHPAGKNIPILAMTASAFDNDRQRCLEVGMNDFISKPVEPERLFAVLLHWLSKPATSSSHDNVT